MDLLEAKSRIAEALVESIFRRARYQVEAYPAGRTPLRFGREDFSPRLQRDRPRPVRREQPGDARRGEVPAVGRAVHLGGESARREVGLPPCPPAVALALLHPRHRSPRGRSFVLPGAALLTPDAG